MTPEQLLREYDLCRNIANNTPPQQPYTIRRAGKTWHVCHFSIESFTVVFFVYVGQRGASSARITVLDKSRQVAAERVSVWSSEHWPLESLLCIRALLASDPSHEQIAGHLRTRTQILLANPRDTIAQIRTFVCQSQTWPVAESVRTLPGGRTGLKR